MGSLRHLLRVHRRRLALGLTVAALGTGLWLRCAPLPHGLLDGRQVASTLVVDREGTPLYEARGDGGVRSVPMSAETIPPILAAATVAAEDHRYWSHPGVDPIGSFARCGATCARDGSSKEGRRSPSRPRSFSSPVKRPAALAAFAPKFRKP